MNAKKPVTGFNAAPALSASGASEFERVGFQIKGLKPTNGLNIGIVRSLFRSALTKQMQAVVEKRAQDVGAKIPQILLARGALETPLLAALLLAQPATDGVVVLAAVIKGQTAHDDVVVRETTRALVKLSLQYGKPVGIGIIGPGVTLQQAHERVTEYAQGALDAVILSASQLKSMKKSKK